METDIKSLPLPLLLRYGLTGLIALALLVVVPLLILSVLRIEELLSVGSVAAVAVFSVATGFILDALKIYQFTPGYTKHRTMFISKMAKELGLPEESVMTYFAQAAFLERKVGGGNIFFMHSRWVMMTVSFTLFSVAGSLALLASSVGLVLGESIELVYRFLIFGIVCLLLGGRLKYTENQERIKVDRAYLEFCKKNREQILRAELEQ